MVEALKELRKFDAALLQVHLKIRSVHRDHRFDLGRRVGETRAEFRQRHERVLLRHN